MSYERPGARWPSKYYPNDTFDEDVSPADPEEVQSYVATASVPVLNAGLIAILF